MPVMQIKITQIETFPSTIRRWDGSSSLKASRPSVWQSCGRGQNHIRRRNGWLGAELAGASVELRNHRVGPIDHRPLSRPELIGRDPFDIEAIHTVMNRVIAPSFSTGQPICKAGLDLALFDLTGQLLGQSPAQRWHRQGQKRLTLSWTLNPRTLDEIEGLVEQGRVRGYRHFNVKVAPDPEFDLELCRIVKRLVPDGFLWADANGGYDEATALAVAPKLADLGVPVLEQPLPPNRLTGYRRLKKQGALPIIMDEGIVSSVELEEFIRLELLDGVAMKPARCGGLTEARRQIEIVQEAGLMFLGSGLSDPDVSLAASLALYAAYDLQYPAALNGPQFLDGTILKQPFAVVDGQLAVPSGPGLGVEVDEERIQEYLVGPS